MPNQWLLKFKVWVQMAKKIFLGMNDIIFQA